MRRGGKEGADIYLGSDPLAHFFEVMRTAARFQLVMCVLSAQI